MAADRVYNAAVLLASASLPYFSSGTAFTNPTAISALYTNYFYDPLQRVTKISDAVGDTTNAYYQWKTTTTDQDSNVKEYGYDAFGNFSSVVEPVATSTTMAPVLPSAESSTHMDPRVRIVFIGGDFSHIL